MPRDSGIGDALSEVGAPFVVFSLSAASEIHNKSRRLCQPRFPVGEGRRGEEPNAEERRSNRS